jgi:hypothetical protein
MVKPIRVNRGLEQHKRDVVRREVISNACRTVLRWELSTYSSLGYGFYLQRAEQASGEASDFPYQTAQRVLRYLDNTASVGIIYVANSLRPNTPRAFRDVSWICDSATRRSTTRYVFIISGAGVSW